MSVDDSVISRIIIKLEGMKNRVCCELVLILLISGYVCSGQQYSVLKADIFGPFQDRFGIAYERSIGNVLSAQLKYEWGIYGDYPLLFGETYRASGHGIIPEIRYYPTGSRKQNIQPFIAAGLRYLRFIEEYQFYSSPDFAYVNFGSVMNAGLNIGCRFRYHRLWSELLVGRGIGGEQYKYSGISNFIPKLLSNEVFLSDARKFYRLEISLGYVFGKEDVKGAHPK